jgi:hypothetical protein
MTTTTWIVALGAAVVALIAWQVLRSGRGQAAHHKELKEQVQTWEDEGGNVPEVPTPSPRTQPQRDRP